MFNPFGRRPANAKKPPERGIAALEELEPRILFSADTPLALVAATLHHDDGANRQLLAQPATSHPANELVFHA